MGEVPIKTALISVYYKEGLEPIVRKLHELRVNIISTGGTESFIKSLDIPVTTVESLTGFPEILGGRVKTLHPKIFGGILGRRELKQDAEQMIAHGIGNIDLVIVDLYPFEETLASTSEESKIIEKIDIGGISLIRAAAKNFNDVLTCASVNEYTDLLKLLTEKNGSSSKEDRRHFAAKAFNISSHYDTAIFNFFNREEKIPAFKQSILQHKKLRYGENPHQEGMFFGNFEEVFTQLNGKEISYNNLVDIDAAVSFIEEFEDPACAIIKHTNACGAAESNTIASAWELALAGDPVSAFGGIIVLNRAVNKEVAERINAIFFEVIIAPTYDEDALPILKQKKNRIIIRQIGPVRKTIQFKSIVNGVIQQDPDAQVASEINMNVVTDAPPSVMQIADARFAEKCAKHLKSNAIALVKNKQLIGMGCGQTSRIDALKQAITKAKSFGFNLEGAALASDAFFPFNDCVEIAHGEKIAVIIQPGGSIRDKDSLDLCNQYRLPMIFTGLRHFRH
jgi:phosphoribosylaminoimidazolecarboxamide formyltransferase/IMP cyclohydrolase